MPRSLLGIIVFALLIRVIGLSSYPPSLNWDEVSHGYNAYSILHTGKDEWGEPFPTIFRAYGDYKLPVYIYLTAISESLLGLNSFAVRMPSALAGAGTVIFSYLLVRKLFKDQRIALLTAFLVAIEPWSFFLSRIALEANVALFFMVSGVYFFILGVEKRSWHLLLSALLFGLSVWTYNSARIFVPLLLVALIFIYRKSIEKVIQGKLLVTGFLLLVTLFFLPMFLQLINPSGQARYGWVRILDEGAIAQIEEQRNTNQINPLIEKLIFNKPAYFMKEFTSNYISHFSPNFLFINGGSHYQFNIPGYGLLHLVNLPFFYIGLVLTFLKLKKKEYKLLAAWIVLAPIASSLTREAPHTLRNIVFLPIPMVLTTLVVNKYLKSKVLLGYLAIVLLFFGSYLAKYRDYSVQYSSSWQYGYKQIVNYVKSNYDKYDAIVITKKYGEPHEFVLFQWPWPPEKYQSDPALNRFYQSNWYWVDGFDKFYFVNDWDIPVEGNILTTESAIKINCENKDCLLITGPGNAPEGWRKLEQVNFLNGETAFEIYQN
jgi:4-amino-4-deoxy-L-arabinose transferase-like glycosyltransferase